MTIPFIAPDVKPLYFDTSQVGKNPNDEAWRERMRTLLTVLQRREDMQLKAREIKLEEAARQDQEQTGLMLADMVRKLNTAPAMTVPTPLGGGVSLPEQPGPIARAFAPGKPGTTYLEAFKTGQNVINTSLARFADAAKERAKAPPKPDVGQLVDEQGFVLSWDKPTATAQHIIGPDGKPVKQRVPDHSGAEPRWRLSGYERNGVPLEYHPEQGFREVRGSAGVFKDGTITEANDRSAGFYRESANAWKTLKADGFPVLPADIVGFMGSARKAVGDNRLFEDFILQSSQYDEPTKRAIMAYATIMANNAYDKSGAVITVKEFTQQLTRVPTGLDRDPKTRQAKLRGLRVGIEGQFQKGYRALRRASTENPELTFEPPYVLFNDDPAADPTTNEPYMDGNPYAQPPQRPGPYRRP